MDLYNVWVKMDEQTGKMVVSQGKLDGGFKMTSDFLSSLAQEDLPKAIELLSSLETKGFLGISTMNKLFTLQHSSYLRKTLKDINGDLDSFNKNLTTGTTVQEGFNKVQQSWAMSIDKLTQTLKNLKGAFTASAMDTAGGALLSLLQGLTGAMTGLSESSPIAKGLFMAFTNAVMVGSIAMVANLTMVRGAFTALKTSIVELATAYPMLFAAIATFTVVFTAVNGTYNSYLKAQEEAGDKAAEEMEKVKKLEQAYKDSQKALQDLANDVSSTNFHTKWKDINDTMRESLETTKMMVNTIKSASDLKAKLAIKIDESEFKKQEQKILRTGITLPNINEKSEGVLASAYKEKARLYSEKYMGTTVIKAIGQDEWNKIVYSQIAKVRKKEKEINDLIAQSVEKEKTKRPYSKAWSEYSALKTAGEKQNYLDVNKIDKVQMEKDMEVVKKYNDGIEAEKGKLLKQLSSKSKELASLSGVEDYGDLFRQIKNQLTQNLTAINENETALMEARQKRLEEELNYLEIFKDEIADVQLQMTKTFMSKTSFDNVKDFEKGLRSQGLTEYANKLKEFGGVINAFGSQSAKMKFLKDDFMNFVSSDMEFKKRIEDTKKIIEGNITVAINI